MRIISISLVAFVISGSIVFAEPKTPEVAPSDAAAKTNLMKRSRPQRGIYGEPVLTDAPEFLEEEESRKRHEQNDSANTDPEPRAERSFAY